MASADSYNSKELRDVLKEHTRELKKYKNYVDLSRSKYNWQYGSTESVDKTILGISARCNDIMQGKKMPDNTNVISEWVVTYPFTECYQTEKPTGEKDENGNDIMHTVNIPKDMKHCRLFFDTVYKFVQDRYGEENVIAGYVHMDETTPQLHMITVPEAISRKTGKKTVSSASLLTRSELKKFHQDLQKKMNEVFGKNDYILNGRTKGNYTIQEMKQRQADKEEIEVGRKKNKKKEDDLTTKEEELKQKQQELQEQEQKQKQEKQQLEQQRLTQQEIQKKQDEKQADFQHQEDKLDAQRKALANDKSDWENRKEYIQELYGNMRSKSQPETTGIIFKKTTGMISVPEDDYKTVCDFMTSVQRGQKLYVATQSEYNQAERTNSRAEKREAEAEKREAEAEKKKADYEQKLKDMDNLIETKATEKANAKSSRELQILRGFAKTHPKAFENYKKIEAEEHERKLRDSLSELDAPEASASPQIDFYGFGK